MNRDIIQIMLSNVIDEGLNITYHSAIEIKAYIDNLEAQLKSKDELLMKAYESINEFKKSFEGASNSLLDCNSSHILRTVHTMQQKVFGDKAQDYISKES